MTARTERAVRAVPGATSDPRESVSIESKSHAQGPLVPTSPLVFRFGPIDAQRAEPLLAKSAGSVSTTVQTGFDESRQTNHEKSIGTNQSLLEGREPPLRPAEIFSRMEHGVAFVAPPSRTRMRSEPTTRTPKGVAYSILYEIEHHRGALEILFLLLWERQATMWRMRSVLRPGPQSLRSALGALAELGLVEPVVSGRETAFPFGSPYRLSAQGRAFLSTRPADWFERFER